MLPTNSQEIDEGAVRCKTQQVCSNKVVTTVGFSLLYQLCQDFDWSEAEVR